MRLQKTILSLAIPVLALTCISSMLTVTGVSAAGFIWAKGNLHTHTTNSDGDSPLKVVAEWYKDHGYQFVVITDHEKLTQVRGANHGIILIPGEELAAVGDSLPTHANAIGISQELKSPKKEDRPDASAVSLINTIRAGGGVPMLNHPYCYGLFGYPELHKVKGVFLFEIHNGSYDPKKWGETFLKAPELMWDALLSTGAQVYGTATDDSHCFKKVDNTPDNPGRAWVVAKVKTLSETAILNALRKGDFYSTTGVELADYSLSDRTLGVRIAPKAGQSYRITFIGKGGSVLYETKGTSASYTFKGKPQPNAYIRCRIVSGSGQTAWTQACRVK